LEELQLAGAKKLEKNAVSGETCPQMSIRWDKLKLNLKQFNQNIRIPHLFSELRTSAKSIILKLETNSLQILCPLFLMQVAADPEHPNKHHGTPLALRVRL